MSEDLARAEGSSRARAGEAARQLIRRTRQVTRRKFPAEEKIRIVLEGIRGEVAASELCWREGIHPTIYYISSDAGGVKMLLLLLFFFVEDTSPLGHTRPFCGECLRTTVGLSHPCPTYVLGPFSFIASVLATRHLFGHWGP